MKKLVRLYTSAAAAAAELPIAKDEVAHSILRIWCFANAS
jgi:hypothetical protein